MHGHKVLIIDDHPDTAEILTRLLERSGFEATSAGSGTAGLTMLRGEERPDAVVLDYMMPDMNGLEVLRAMRSDQRLKDVPVIMYSADATPDRADEALAAGAQEYVLKGSCLWSSLAAKIARMAGAAS